MVDNQEGQQYSVIPDKLGGVHYAYDRDIRSAFFHHTMRTSGIRAVCDRRIRMPDVYLPVGRPCADCVAGLEPGDKPRPAPGNPLLHRLAALYPGPGDSR